MSNIIGVRNNNTILPYQAATKRTKEVTLTVTSTQAGWSTTHAKAIFYADSAGVWRMRFNISGSFNKTTITRVIATISNISIGTTQGIIGIAGATDNLSDVGAFLRSYLDTSSSCDFQCASTTNCAAVRYSGDVELNAEPTTYTTAANMEGVVAVDVYIPPASATEDGIVNRSAQSFAGVKTYTNGISLGNETLSVYDEGTWIPSITDSAGVAAFLSWTTSPTGRYTRIGNVVTAKLMFRTAGAINPACTSSNQIRISVPFTSANDTPVSIGLCQLYIGSTSMEGKELPIATLSGNTNYLLLESGPLTGPANNKSPVGLTIANIEGGLGAQLTITINYFV